MPSDRYLAKGGSYAGFINGPFEFHIDIRMDRSDDALYEMIGFRIAKSEAPAIDMARSLIQARYATGALQGSQEPDLASQLGMERYHLDKDGRIESYEATSLVPLNFVLGDKRSRFKDLAEKTHSAPVPVGVLVLSGKVAQPALDQQLYTVLYREKGMHKDLEQALKDANKDLIKAAKKGEEVDGKDAGVVRWRKALRRFGITEEEAAADGAPKDIDFVRIPGSPVKIPTDDAAVILLDNEENVAAVIPQKKGAKAARKLEPGIALDVPTKGDGIAGKERITWTFGVPLNPDSRAKPVEFQLQLVLDSVPNPSNPWRR